MRKVIIPTRSEVILFCLVFFALNGIPGLAAEDKIMIGFSQATMNHPWRVAMVAENTKYAAEHYLDVDLIVTDGQNSATKQVSDVESLMTRGIKVLIISPLQAQALTPIVKQVMEAKIPVVTLDREVNTNVTCRIGAENKPIGENAGKLIAEKLGSKGNIIEIQGTAGASATIDRHNGFRDSLRDAPKIKVVADQYCDYLREPAVKFVEDMLQRFGPGQIQAIYAHNDEMALGAAKAVADAGRTKEIIIVGIDGENSAFEAIKDGKLAATFIYPFCAPEGVVYAYKIARGEQVPERVILQSTRVDASNVDQYLGKGF
jgi:ribose transport system substrate-binding protein